MQPMLLAWDVGLGIVCTTCLAMGIARWDVFVPCCPPPPSIAAHHYA